MYKFAHLADCHLGAQKDPTLKKLEIAAFKECLNKCIEEKVDFIIIAGDLFHSNLPDMGIVKETVKNLKKVNEEGIPVYINYGSHDFSPNGTSIIDVITETGLLKKLFIPEIVEDENGNEKLKLKFTVDKKTNAKLTGISGRKSGNEEYFFEILDRDSLEKEEGFKIFVFHTGVEGMIPSFLSKMDYIKQSYFPKNFDYYAGGHIHQKIERNPEGYGPMAYPGPLFAGFPRDLELSAQGEKRGFFIVEFDEKVQNRPYFYELNTARYKYFPTFSADNKNPNQIYEEIVKAIDKCDVKGKIVIIKIRGQLSSGRSSDVNFNEIRKILKEKGAIYISINRHSLVSNEFSKITFKGDSDDEIEENLLRDNTININVKTKNLKENGAKIAKELIQVIRESPHHNEKKIDYNNRILKVALGILELEGL